MSKLKRLSVSILITAWLTIAFVHANSDLDVESPQLTIAVASNFQFPLSTLIAQSEYWSKQPVRIVVGSSGTLYAQLSKGAPFDLFFSADSERPIRLEQNNLASSRQTYARGKLVLFPAHDQFVNSINERNILDVTGKLAIANPQLAPFGEAAVAYIATLHNAGSLPNHYVLGANVTQAFQFVDSGNAELGLLAESVLIHAQHRLQNPKYSDYMPIPVKLYPPIIQQLVIANTSQHKEHAQRFVDFVTSAESQQVLSLLGYMPISDAQE
jgi:molybdenum ABC transporter molybdate-binding protein